MSAAKTPGIECIFVSVVICTRNRASQLARALEAWRLVVAEMEWELLVVDSNSTDDTWEVIAAAAMPRLRAVSEKRPGLGAARDSGWRVARGQLIAFTDDDCYPATDYVCRIAEVFREHPGIGFLGGRILLHNPIDLRLTIDEREEAVHIPAHRFVSAGAVQGANLAFRRRTLERIGGFDPNLGAGTRFPCEDIDAVAAAVWAGVPGCYDPRPVVWHDHGRRSADEARALRVQYDRGRGAYYMKYLLRKDSRRAYFAAWALSVWGGRYREGVRRSVREFVAAAQFVRAKASARTWTR